MVNLPLLNINIMKKKIKQLKIDMDVAIKAQDYKKAIILRDLIHQLEGNLKK